MLLSQEHYPNRLLANLTFLIGSLVLFPFSVVSFFKVLLNLPYYFDKFGYFCLFIIPALLFVILAFALACSFAFHDYFINPQKPCREFFTKSQIWLARLIGVPLLAIALYFAAIYVY